MPGGTILPERPVLTPIGGIVAWLKSFTNTPALPFGWVECNGQTLNDSQSVYNGQVLPNLNGNNRFLRGNSTSGGTGGEASHSLSTDEMPSHIHALTTAQDYGNDGLVVAGINRDAAYETTIVNTGSAGTGAAHENRPPFYDVVWIMRVK